MLDSVDLVGEQSSLTPYPCGFTESLPTTEQKALARYFAAARKGKESVLEPECREILAEILHGLSTGTVGARSDL